MACKEDDPNLKELERDLICPICKEHFTEPKMLPCLHYYCKKCILKLSFRTATGEPFHCPLCRKETMLPEGGVDELKTAFFIYRMEVMYSTVERIQGKVRVVCEGCKTGSVAVSFCRQCSSFICTACVESHQRMKIFEGHDIVSLSDLKSGKAKVDISSKEMTSPVECKVHKESMKLYCFDCDLLICRDCTLFDHKDHNFVFCADAAPQTKEQLSKMLEPLRKTETIFSQALEKAQTMKEEVDAQGKYVANCIRSSFKELFEIMERRELEMLKEARDLTQEKVARLSEQEEDLSITTCKVRSVVEQTDKLLRFSSDCELMNTHTEIMNEIEVQKEAFGEPGYINVVEEADMGVKVRCAEALQELCQTEAKITRSTLNSACCVVRGEGVNTAEVNQASEVTLITKLSNNKDSCCYVKVDSHLNSLHDGSVVKCGVHQLRTSTYHIQYTPTVRGRHELSISVNGEQVAWSPFPVFVSIPPTKLGRPVKPFLRCSSNKVCGISMNSLGHVIVLMDDIKCIAIYDGADVINVWSGRDLRLHNYELKSLAVDDQDNLYISTCKSTSIAKVNKDGVLVKKVQVAKSNNYLGVLVLDEEVMVCNNLRDSAEVVVYDKDLHFVKKMVNEDFIHLHDISADSHKNIYLTDCNKGCVHVVSHHGDLLQSFSCDVHGERILTRPLGIHVAGQFVYVCNNGREQDNHNVSVFTTEGRHVCTFGHKGKEEGEFEGPTAIYTDSDGFVYVCDSNNRRIQIF